jgi:hypothetical protein
MKRHFLLAILISGLFLSSLSATQIVTDKDGRTTSVKTGSSANDAITVLVTDGDVDELTLLYRPVLTLTQPFVLSDADLKVKPDQARTPATFIFCSGYTTDSAEQPNLEKAPCDSKWSRAPFVIYNIVEHRAAKPNPPPAPDPAIKAALLEKIKDAQKELKTLTAVLAQINADLEGFTKIPAPEAVLAIKDLQKQRRDTQALIQAQNDIIEKAKAAVVVEDEKSALAESAKEAQILRKVGVIIQGARKRPIVYNFSAATGTVPDRLVRVSDLPRLTDFDIGYVIVSNIVPKDHPQPFDITVTWKAGSVLTLTPVRPVLDVPGTKGTAKLLGVDLSGEDTAYRDVVAEIESLRFHGGEVPQLTVQTRGRAVTADKIVTTDGTVSQTKTEEVKDILLLDKSDLPQVRTHYRYNFTTGIAASSLRNPAFQKVRTVADDPTTTIVNEARYRIDRQRGDRRVNGFLGLTYYLRGIDTLRPLTLREALIPNPTVGFGLSEPLENAFFGFSNEIVRNGQIVWGIHCGKVNELVERNDINENEDATAPVTKKKFHAKPFIGLTLNLKFLDKVFGR